MTENGQKQNAYCERHTMNAKRNANEKYYTINKYTTSGRHNGKKAAKNFFHLLFYWSVSVFYNNNNGGIVYRPQ